MSVYTASGCKTGLASERFRMMNQINKEIAKVTPTRHNKSKTDLFLREMDAIRFDNFERDLSLDK